MGAMYMILKLSRLTVLSAFMCLCSSRKIHRRATFVFPAPYDIQQVREVKGGGRGVGRCKRQVACTCHYTIENDSSVTLHMYIHIVWCVCIVFY